MGKRLGLGDIKDLGAEGVLKEIAKQTVSKTEKRISTVEQLTAKIKEKAASHDQTVAEKKQQERLSVAADEAINQAIALPNLEENPELLGLVEQLEREMNKASHGTAPAVGNTAKKLLFLQSLKTVKGGKADWPIILKLAASAREHGALTQTGDSRSSLYFVIPMEGKEKKEIYFDEANGLTGRIDKMISIEVHRIYAEKKEAEKAAFQARIQEEKAAKQRLFDRNDKISYGELVTGQAGSMIVVVRDRDGRYELGAFVIESDGKTAKVTEPTSERVESLLSKHGCFREFSVDNTDSIPGLLKKLVQTDQEHMEAQKRRREDRKAEAEKHREALAAKADITLTRANEGDAGTFYVPIDRFLNRATGYTVFGAFLARRNADGRVQIMEVVGEAGKLIPEIAYKRALPWEQFTQNFLPVIKVPLQRLARAEGILLPGMTPMEERKPETAQVTIVPETTEKSE
ncbi:MAG: hypothetical protein HZC14_02980 [Candidatus Niyogibacteria bacterium]|nr:hypothetical protein [Candidatus Niyogibacteria bacterium]